MKVGILTHHWLYNFGANLQALATVSCLRKLGYKPVILNYRIPELVAKYDAMVTNEQRMAHVDFCNKYLPESEICTDTQTVVQVAKQCQLGAVVSGSDAVLRIDPRSNRDDLGFPNPFWLNWTEHAGINRSGFLATSAMGSNFWDIRRQQRIEMGRATDQLSYIGVRDRWTERMLRLCHGTKTINYCPDPVSVFNDDVDIDSEAPSNDNYILFSGYKKTVSKDWIKEFVGAANEKGFRVFSLPHPELVVDGSFDQVLKLPMSPIQWWNWLKHSKGYVGVRFHPIMISLVNGTPFVSLDQYQTGLRFKNRFLTKAALPLRPWFSWLSKTYDIATRSDKVQYCLNPRQYKKKSGKDIFELLHSQMDSSQQNEFVNSTKTIFRSTLQKICGGAPFLQPKSKSFPKLFLPNAQHSVAVHD